VVDRFPPEDPKDERRGGSQGCGWGCGLLILILVLIPALPYCLMAYGCFFMPAEPGPQVSSPDGRLNAFTTLRGALDSYNYTLFVQRGHDRPRKLLGHVRRGVIKWSPDSRKIAIVDTSSRRHVGVQVIDAASGSSGYGFIDLWSKHFDWEKAPQMACQWRDNSSLICGRCGFGEIKSPLRILRVKRQAGALMVEEQK
jgi:hypothetical protein